MTTNKTITTVDSGQGQSISVVGDTYSILISGEQTNGAYAVINMLVPPGGGPGPHAHKDIQEMFYIVEGGIDFKMEGGGIPLIKVLLLIFLLVARFTLLKIQQTRLHIYCVQ